MRDSICYAGINDIGIRVEKTNWYGKNKLAKFAELETFTNVFRFKSVCFSVVRIWVEGKWNEQYFQNPQSDSTRTGLR